MWSAQSSREAVRVEEVSLYIRSSTRPPVKPVEFDLLLSISLPPSACSAHARIAARKHRAATSRRQAACSGGGRGEEESLYSPGAQPPVKPVEFDLLSGLVPRRRSSQRQQHMPSSRSAGGMHSRQQAQQAQQAEGYEVPQGPKRSG